ncbi:hypothetical protein AB0H36_07115 [Kribbella sp. NPDC050820]|uniref:hypothetical protein n=1 Tax=Kribbella sp. NPDC050820 TaxID=3155408 RepID=UPI0033C361D7
MNRFAVLCAGFVLLSGCSEPPMVDSTSTTPSISTPPVEAPEVSTPVGPLGTAAYQSELTKIEQGLAGDLRALTRVRTAEALTQTMDNLAASLNAAAEDLAELTVTRRLAGVHKVLSGGLEAAADALSTSDRTESNARCGGVAYTSQKVQRRLRADLSSAIVALRKLDLRFGNSLPDPGPEPEAETPTNGDTLVRRGPAGSGRLRVMNGTANDVAISIVSTGQPPSKPHVMTYVEAGKTATISRIGGAYSLYFKSGTDWSPSRRQFSADCSFQKFERSFGRNQSWQVDLKRTITGNAPTTEVEAY